MKSLGYLILCLCLSFSLNTVSARTERVERPHFHLITSGPVDLTLTENVIENTRQICLGSGLDSLSYIPEIYIAFSEPEFDSLMGGYFPDWGAAAAMPARKRIVIKSPAVFDLGRDYAPLLAHEYIHLVLAERTVYRPIPRWLTEGMALYLTAEWTWSDNLAMSNAAVFGQYVPFDEIESVNRFSSSKAHLAYAQSYLTVNYLFDAYGLPSVNIVLDRLEAGDDINAALLQATGSNLIDFQTEVWASFEPRFNLLSLFVDTIYFWVALAIIVVVAGILNYRRRRQYFKKWEEEEQLRSTDFDYGNPDNPEQVDDEDEPWRS